MVSVGCRGDGGGQRMGAWGGRFKEGDLAVEGERERDLDVVFTFEGEMGRWR